MSSARPNSSVSIQRKLRAATLPRAKLQKSQAALQEFVTAMLQRAGPPRRMSRSMSQVLDAIEVTALLGSYTQPCSPARFRSPLAQRQRNPGLLARRGFPDTNPDRNVPAHMPGIVSDSQTNRDSPAHPSRVTEP